MKIDTTRCRTFGPLKDLERHVADDWWRHIFNSLYLKTDADVVEDSTITGEEVSLFAELLGLKSDDKILDLCCGQGRHCLKLAERGFRNIIGADSSAYLIQKARMRTRKAGLGVTFTKADARSLPFGPAGFDVVLIVGNSFGYFASCAEDLAMLREARRVLRPGGRLLMDVTDGQYLARHFEQRSWEWINRSFFVCRERSLSKDGRRMISRELITHVEQGVIADQFYAERLYGKDELANLLAEAGFVGCEVHREVSPNSKRNQDLGMMGRRFIITASAAE